MDGWCDQRSEPRTEPLVSPLPEIRATCPQCTRADFRRNHRAQNSWHRTQIRACANVEKVRRDRQAAGDTPPGGVPERDRARDRQFSAPQLFGLETEVQSNVPA